MKQAYLWLDTEMTGLDIAHAALLEVGAAVVTEDLQPISTFERVLYFSRADMNPAIRDIEPVVQDMHHKNGLWDECEHSKLLPVEVDLQLHNWTRAFFAPGEVILGGRSIWFDRKVAELHLPRFHGLLHHRQLETFTLQRANEKFGLPRVSHEHPHRALADVLDDLRVAREYLRQLGPDRPEQWWTL